MAEVSEKDLQEPTEGEATAAANSETNLVEETDPWALADPDLSNIKPWKEMTSAEKVGRVFGALIRIALALVLLFFFIISIDVLGSAFKILAGRAAGNVFTNSELLSNPVCCMMIGVLVTVLLQSSSTSTSIVVTMVAASIIPVRNAIFIIMGANIGTSITNTIVSVGHISSRDEFRRAFAGATVHDAFNWLSVVLLLPVEVVTGYLYNLTHVLVQNIDTNSDIEEPQFLEILTDPVASKIIKVDKKVISGIVQNKLQSKRPLVKFFCETGDGILNYTSNSFPATFDKDMIKESSEYKRVLNDKSFPAFWAFGEKFEIVGGNAYFTYKVPLFDEAQGDEPCEHIFTGAGLPDSSVYEHPSGWPKVDMSDDAVGVILLIVSLIALCACLIGLVSLLTAALKGPIIVVVRAIINSDMQFGDKLAPGNASLRKALNVFGRELAGYCAIVVGCLLTILVQSSSVFTSAMTPLVGMGLIAVERMYPLTLGANIGTTVTALLAAFTSDPDKLTDALQVALAHLFFNLTGILIFYPVPFMRRVPVNIAKKLGNTVAKYRWFAFVYLFAVFLLLPFFVFILSLAGWFLFAAVCIPLLIAGLALAALQCVQDHWKQRLPEKLQTFEWMPVYMRSLEPYDTAMTKACSCCSRHAKAVPDAEKGEGSPEKVATPAQSTPDAATQAPAAADDAKGDEFVAPEAVEVAQS